MRQRQSLPLSLSFFGLILFLVVGQIGCTQTGFTSTQEKSKSGNNNGLGLPTPPPPGDSNKPPQTDSAIKDQTVVTQINTPVSFTAALAKDDAKPKALTFPDQKQSFTSQVGVLEIIDASKLQFRYTPNAGFRGTDAIQIYLTDSNNVISQATLTIDVANALSTAQPALVTRTTGCIMCHNTDSTSNIASNIITDFGYGGDGRGLNYFFGGVPGVIPNDSTITNAQGGSMYGDYDFSQGHNVNWGSANITAAKVIVPFAPTTGLPNIGADTLALYLKGIFSNPNVASPNVMVEEVSSIYIGAPTEQRIRDVSGLASPEVLKFTPEDAHSPPLSGLTLSPDARFYTNDDTIVCNGDVVLDGLLYLHNAKISTDLGCRLYVTKSVFISGPITFTSQNSLRNLQISSARSVLLGIGNSCSVQGSVDSIRGRLTPSDNRFAGAFTRNLGTPTEMLALLNQDAQAIGTLQDATCGENGRAVAFERLLLNAPVIESRYQGEFSGTMISEITMTSLSSLKYQFDPVFSSAVILPLLAPSDYLTIKQ